MIVECMIDFDVIVWLDALYNYFDDQPKRNERQSCLKNFTTDFTTIKQKYKKFVPYRTKDLQVQCKLKQVLKSVFGLCLLKRMCFGKISNKFKISKTQ